VAKQALPRIANASARKSAELTGMCSAAHLVTRVEPPRLQIDQTPSIDADQRSKIGRLAIQEDWRFNTSRRVYGFTKPSKKPGSLPKPRASRGFAALEFSRPVKPAQIKGFMAS
jgi:hypothetical protein